ncbi:hypothetical protein F892_02030 [Acinetobacter vivianii]|uniref:Uncharacterized protein n=1 Tax=Acinetobacter vivianii TaxID=1776742 RepID=N9NP58_9GAMM|nr:hypothetical protein F892_02030 [Acinetobacter vivianii]
MHKTELGQLRFKLDCPIKETLKAYSHYLNRISSYLTIDQP